MVRAGEKFCTIDSAGYRTIELLYAPSIGPSILRDLARLEKAVVRAIDRALSFLCNILQGISACSPVWRAIGTPAIIGVTIEVTTTL